MGTYARKGGLPAWYWRANDRRRGRRGGGAGGAPLYIFAGQSNADSGTGTPLPANYGTLDSRIKFWTTDGAWETYDPGVNSGSGADHPEFWGPEAAFAYHWRQENPGRTIYMVKHAVPATSLATAGGEDWNPATDAELWDDLLAKIAAAVEALPQEPTYLTFNWIHGETDGLVESYANAYETNLTAFIAAVRAEISADIRFVAARISDSTEWTYGATVRAAQEAVIDAADNAAWVDADDLPLRADDQHYTNAGIDTLGRRLFQAAASGPVDFDLTLGDDLIVSTAEVGDVVGTLDEDTTGYRELDFGMNNAGAAETASIGDVVGMLGDY